MAELRPKLLTDEVAARCFEVDNGRRFLMIGKQMVPQQTDERVDRSRSVLRVAQLIVIGVYSQRAFFVNIRVPDGNKYRECRNIL